MDTATERYLTSLAGDSARWKRMGLYGATTLIEGILEALVATGAISDGDALSWKELILAPFNISRATYISAEGEAASAVVGNSAQIIPRFLEMISAREPAKDVLGVCSIQILGIERYDSKGAILWRVAPLEEPNAPADPSGFGAFRPGPEMAEMELTDDVGTVYILMGGNSAGRVERVGRFEFRPAPPDGAKHLRVRWQDVAFTIALPGGMSHIGANSPVGDC
jgi:hypothetical protein